MLGGPAAGRVLPGLPGQHPAVQQVGQGQVVVGGDAGARPTTVLEQDRLIGVVAQTQLSNLQQDGPQAAGGVRSGPPGPDQEGRTPSRGNGWIPGPVHQRGCFWFLTWKRQKVAKTGFFSLISCFTVFSFHRINPASKHPHETVAEKVKGGGLSPQSSSTHPSQRTASGCLLHGHTAGGRAAWPWLQRFHSSSEPCLERLQVRLMLRTKASNI